MARLTLAPIIVLSLFARPAFSVEVEQIVIPDHASAAERHAASQIRVIVRQMTGQRLELVGESKAGKRRSLVVGRTKSNLSVHNPDKWPKDTIYIGYGAGDIAIVGQGSQGTLFAAFEFLRDQGCRWYMPVTYHKMEVGVHIPKRNKLLLNRPPRKHTPSFADRGWHMTPVMPGPHFRDWATRNGLNSFTTGSTTIRYKEHLGRGYEKQTGHTLGWFVPSGSHPSVVKNVLKSFSAHPTWYPEVGGKRTYHYRDGRAVQACLANDQVVQKVATRIVELAKSGYGEYKNPKLWLVSIGHNDEPTYWCECEKCRSMDGANSRWHKNDVLDAYPDHAGHKGAKGPLSRRYVLFANRVAMAVATKRPELKISFYAYGSTVAPPRDRNLKLAPNVVVELAYSGRCLKHDIHDPDCPTNVQLKKWIIDWTRRGQLIFYDYPPTGRHIHAPTGFLNHYKSLYRFLHRQGVLGLSGENQGVWAGSSLHHYVRARLMWDVKSDVERITREYCRDLYGSAAKTMLAYHRRYERGLAQHPGHMIYGRWVPGFSDKVIRDMQSLLDRAKQEARTPAVQLRLKFAQIGLNTFVITRVQNTPLARLSDSTHRRYRQLLVETHTMIRKLNLPYPMAATGPFFDRMKADGYQPPFAALKGKQRLEFPKIWRFRTDPRDQGVKLGWHKRPRSKSSPWRDLRIDKFWTHQGIRFYGAAWYATTFTAPKAKSENVWLLFDMLDGAGQIWVDGKLAGSVPADPWDKPKAVRLAKLLKPGQRHQLVIRVVKRRFAAGINGRVRIMEAVRRVGDR